LGPDFELGGEGQFLAVVQVGDLHLGLAEGDHVAVSHRLGVQLGYRVVDRLGEHHVTADPPVDHRRRDAARPEARDADLAADLAVGLIEAGLQLIERHLDAQPDSGRAQLFDVSLHVRVTPGLWMVTQQGSLGSLRSLSRQSRGYWTLTTRTGGGSSSRSRLSRMNRFNTQLTSPTMIAPQNAAQNPVMWKG